MLHYMCLWCAEFYELAGGCKFVNIWVNSAVIYIISAGRARKHGIGPWATYIIWGGVGPMRMGPKGILSIDVARTGNKLFICHVQDMLNMILTFRLDTDSNVWQPTPILFYVRHRSTRLGNRPHYRTQFVSSDRGPRARRQVQVQQCSHQTQCT